VRDSEAGDVVAAATDADLQVALTGGAHRGDDVADRGTADDQLRAVIDHPIPDRPGGVVPARARSEDLTIEVRTVNGGGGELRCSGHGTMVPRNRFPDKVQFCVECEDQFVAGLGAGDRPGPSRPRESGLTCILGGLLLVIS